MTAALVIAAALSKRAKAVSTLGALMANLINVERATVGYGTRTLLDAVSLGVDEGDAIGVVGRNGDGKTTLLQVLTGDAGHPTPAGSPTPPACPLAWYDQTDDFAAEDTVRELIVGDAPTMCGRASRAPGLSSSICCRASTWIPWARSAAASVAGPPWSRYCCPGTTCWCSTSRPTTSTSRRSGGSPSI